MGIERIAAAHTDRTGSSWCGLIGWVGLWSHRYLRGSQLVLSNMGKATYELQLQADLTYHTVLDLAFC